MSLTLITVLDRVILYFMVCYLLDNLRFSGFMEAFGGAEKSALSGWSNGVSLIWETIWCIFHHRKSFSSNNNFDLDGTSGIMFEVSKEINNPHPHFL